MILHTFIDECEIVPDTTTGALVSGMLAARTWNSPKELHTVALFAASRAWASTRYLPMIAVQGTTQSFPKVPERAVPSVL